MSTIRDLQMFQYAIANTGGPLGPRLPDLLSILSKGIKAIWRNVKKASVTVLRFVVKTATAFKKHMDDGANAHNRMMDLQDERYQRNWYHIRTF